MNKLAACRAGFAQWYFEKRAGDAPNELKEDPRPRHGNDEPAIDAKSRRWLDQLSSPEPIAALKDIYKPDTRTGRVPGHWKMYKWLNQHTGYSDSPLEDYRRFAAANTAAAALNAISGKPAGALSIGDLKDVPGLLRHLEDINGGQAELASPVPDRVEQAKNAWAEYRIAINRGLLPPKLDGKTKPFDHIVPSLKDPLNTIKTYNSLRNNLGLDYTTALSKIPPKDRALVNMLIRSGVISPAVK